MPAVILLNRPIDGSARGLDRALATAEEVARREGADTVALRSVRAATSVDDLPISKSRS
ncbi:hypothetical protein ACIHDR_47590 [Nocardia sp. NPDC052278]|uniref:hypothetical protein n=1 Tax=unclassified Nocardia TaxID=2637762 RepID=UPI0036B3E31D